MLSITFSYNVIAQPLSNIYEVRRQPERKESRIVFEAACGRYEISIASVLGAECKYAK